MKVDLSEQRPSAPPGAQALWPRRMMAGQGARVRKLASRLRRGPDADASLTSSTPPAPRPVVSGVVEEFSPRLVVGWVSVPADAAPTRVDLFVNNFRLTSTYATPDAAMSGVNSVLRRGGQPETGAGGPTRARVHHWQAPPIAGPADDRRNSDQQIRTFSFGVPGLWPYVRRGTRITVRVDGSRCRSKATALTSPRPREGSTRSPELRAEARAGLRVLAVRPGAAVQAARHASGNRE